MGRDFGKLFYSSIIHSGEQMPFTVLSDCQNKKTDRCHYTVQNYQKKRHFLPNKIDHMLGGKGK